MKKDIILSELGCAANRDHIDNCYHTSDSKYNLRTPSSSKTTLLGEPWMCVIMLVLESRKRSWKKRLHSTDENAIMPGKKYLFSVLIKVQIPKPRP